MPTPLVSIHARPAVCCPFAWGALHMRWDKLVFLMALATALALIGKPISGTWGSSWGRDQSNSSTAKRLMT